MKQHRYRLVMEWTGNRGSGTSEYRAYDRAHRIAADGKESISGSSDPSFRGDASAWNPEELLVSALSACHMLWYLHLAADAGVVVTAYRDRAEGIMTQDATGGGRFTAVTLRPHITLAAGSDAKQALRLHEQAHRFCFIANSVNFPVVCEPTIEMADR